jgi:hypothetical protein
MPRFPPFVAKAKCPKCGTDCEHNTRWGHYDDEGHELKGTKDKALEGLHRRCCLCGYDWMESALDADEKDSPVKGK